jgi:uncharacterized membrane protein
LWKIDRADNPAFFVSAIAGAFTLLPGRIMHAVVFGS